jgi:hypothetical protein
MAPPPFLAAATIVLYVTVIDVAETMLAPVRAGRWTTASI